MLGQMSKEEEVGTSIHKFKYEYSLIVYGTKNAGVREGEMFSKM